MFAALGFHVVTYAMITIIFLPHVMCLLAFAPLEKLQPRTLLARARWRAPRMVSVALVLAITPIVPQNLSEAPAALAGRSPGSPNVLVIVTDDQRADTMAPLHETKRLLGKRGVRFTNAYTTTPACCPARASIFSGLYAHNHGVRTNDGRTTDNLDHASTLQAYLQEAGYTTALYGKYLNGYSVTRNPPYFDRWAFFSDVASRYYRDNQWNINGNVRTVGRYSTRFIQKKVLGFIGSPAAQERPWLTYVTTAAPHAPFSPEIRYKTTRVRPFRLDPAMTERDRSDKPVYVRGQERDPSRQEGL